MPSWNELQDEFGALPEQLRTGWLRNKQQEYFNGLSAHLKGRNVLFYGSAFLQKQVPAPMISITPEDINGMMSVIYGMDWDQGLTLVLHTPGGSPNAAETIVDYLRSKFESFDVIVPAYAMSAGTMISLSSDKITMGRQSQLGPIDPQLTIGGRTMSARGVVSQFEQAQSEILANPAAAHVWAPITQSLGPALLADSQSALAYSEQVVANWLEKYMFSSLGKKAGAKAKEVAHHFNDASTHKSHGRRIDMAEAQAQGLNVVPLEDDQILQELVLSMYHLITLVFEISAATKIICGSNDRTWLKNIAPTQP